MTNTGSAIAVIYDFGHIGSTSEAAAEKGRNPRSHHRYRYRYCFPATAFRKSLLDHIADVADPGKGTIYNYFATKEDIVVAFMVDREREVQDKVNRLTFSWFARGSKEP